MVALLPGRATSFAYPQQTVNDWTRFASCTGRTDLFFDDTTVTRARAICRSCPVAMPCLTTAVANHEEWGIWAGTGPNTRRSLRRRATGPPCPNPSIVCDCTWCRTLLLTMIGRTRNSNSKGARCGHRSTAARGCNCSGCRHENAYQRRVQRLNESTPTTTTVELPTPPPCELHHINGCRACIHEHHAA